MKSSFSINNILYILAVSVIVGFLYNTLSPDGIGLIREEIKLESFDSSSEVEAETDYTRIKAVKIDDAYKFYNDGVTFIDSRDMWEFAEGHIKGAINFPFIEYESTHSALNELSKDERLVIYCSSTECGLSTKLAIELQKLGYRKLFVFEEGWDAWVERGYPTETGDME